MKKIKNLYYWSPFIDKVATIKATYNSVKALNRYSNFSINCKILDVYGEWENFNYFGQKKKIFYELNNLTFLRKFSSNGFFNSRLKYLVIFIYSFFPLKNFLEKNKPDFLIIHLITSLPLILNFLFNFQTKMILRISGKPKLNFFRKFLWQICLKKIYKVTCPTQETLEYLKKLKLTDSDKFELLYDPILDLEEFRKEKNEDFQKKNYYLAVGRLTKQKNFSFLIYCFNEIIKKNPNTTLIIAGEGEYFKSLNNLILNLNLEKNIILVGFQENIFKYFKNCKAFILSSLWEDPGFVLIEAMLTNTLILTSDCPSGPKEIVGNERGIIFKNNSRDDFLEKYNELNNLNKKQKNKLLLNAKKFTKNFNLINHYRKFKKIIYV